MRDLHQRGRRPILHGPAALCHANPKQIRGRPVRPTFRPTFRPGTERAEIRPSPIAEERAMATPDLIIRGGTVVDGTGAKAFTADVAVTGGTITEVGKVTARADREIDA